jgi:hypothetical protein
MNATLHTGLSLCLLLEDWVKMQIANGSLIQVLADCCP